MAKHFMLLGHTIALITAHEQGQHLWLSQFPGSTPNAPNQWKSDIQVKN